ncbi:MAG: hypothetical protein KJ818_03245, partial [Candidatus Omnitrophica bacterium]|nr:hypothetical protein [Candidatus Omnitrophota bacterium]
MFIFYDLIFLLVAIILLPKYLLKRKFRSAFLSRLGQLPEGLSLDRPIWIHAVSVGEVMAVRGLIDELRKAYPQKKFVISTVTATGNKIANSLAKPGDLVTYLPLDLSFIVKGLINKIDLLPHVDFNVQACKEAALKVNPSLEFIEISATQGDGIQDWLKWLRNYKDSHPA